MKKPNKEKNRIIFTALDDLRFDNLGDRSPLPKHLRQQGPDEIDLDLLRNRGYFLKDNFEVILDKRPTLTSPPHVLRGNDIDELIHERRTTELPGASHES